MKNETVKNLINKMANNQTVKLRKSKHGGIASKTFDAICDYLISECNAKSVTFENTTITIVYFTGDKLILSDKIELY